MTAAVGRIVESGMSAKGPRIEACCEADWICPEELRET
jgi:hypothetical protein